MSPLKTVLLVALLGTFFASTNCLEGITELTDKNFAAQVQSEPSFWIVLFAAEWCGHCKRLKPEFEKLASMLQESGVKLGHVDAKGNDKLVNDHVVDHKTHMVSYPKMKVFLGKEDMGLVPSGMRTATQIRDWFSSEFQNSGEL